MPYNRDEHRWLAWQFDRPEHGDGVVEAFRREKAEAASTTMRLQGLDPAARYRITGPHSLKATIASGNELLENGLPVQIDERPGAAVVRYERLN